jgi:hypothetical protein
MTIDTRGKEAAQRAHEELALLDVPDVEMVIRARRAQRRRTRTAWVFSAAAIVLAGAGIGVLGTRDGSSPHASFVQSTPTTTPVRAGLSFVSFHWGGCPFQGIDGCTSVSDEGSSSDVAAASVRNDDATKGAVIVVTLTPAAAERFAHDSVYQAYIDGGAVNMVRGARGTLVLSRDAVNSWDTGTAQALAARILASR